MTNNETKRLRWVVLGIYSFLTLMIQVQWLSFAPIAREARVVYDVSPFQIDLLSLVFMLVFLPVCFPASSLIERFDLKTGVGIGAVLMSVFSLIKGLFADNYTIILIAQTGLAVAQPFFLNSSTKLAGKWFPVNERVTAVGIATLAQFAGIVLVMILTPLLFRIRPDGSDNLESILLLYGVIAVFATLLFFIVVPKDSARANQEYEPAPPLRLIEGIRMLLRRKDVILLMIMFFIGLGQFNAISTCIDQICEKKHFSVDQTGMTGGLMLIAGIIGALIFPVLSDYFRKRKPFLVLSMVMTTIGILGLTVSQSYPLMLLSSFILGFFLLGAGAPVGFQYGAEIAEPVPESTTQGLVLFIGQVSGILFIIFMNLWGMIPLLVAFTALGVINIFISLSMSESPAIHLMTPKKN
ncbi:MAG: MFS transporter [Bacteroidales bacterium]